MKKSLLSCFLFLHFSAFCQDTLQIAEVSITTSLLKQTLARSTAAAAIVDSLQLKLQGTVSLVPAFNAVPGVRMEERSPGSYRLSIRGSLLRSPFGIRNVKLYMDDYPLTDAGGNSYLNVLAMNGINKIEILKGPDGSLFGANSGGVISIQTARQKDNVNLEVATGSFGLFKQAAAITSKMDKHVFSIAESYQRADGYRDNSGLRRFYMQASDNWTYSKSSALKAFVFYSDLKYQTPGGLTQVQYDARPKDARQPTATLPGAVEQRAAVYNSMWFAGVTHTATFGKHIEHVAAVFGSTVNFKNPFITNYEHRRERTAGFRTYLTFSNSIDQMPNFRWQYNLGMEWQETNSSIWNYGNNRGNKSALLSSGKLLSDQHFIFNRVKLDINKKLVIEVGLSLNYYSYRFRDSTILRKKFVPQWLPRAAISYLIDRRLTVRSSVSRGYSSPTAAEIRPSDNNIYTGLQAEAGMNVEAGARYFSLNNRFHADVAIYSFRLKDAIVRQQNVSGEEYFVNAGSTKQHGLEAQVSYDLISAVSEKAMIRKLTVSNSSTLSDFNFKQYSNGAADFSGNRITGVPSQVFVSSVLVQARSGIYVFIQHNYTSRIPLNDANRFYSKSFNLTQVKFGLPVKLRAAKFEFYVGADNIFNERYSLGNDLNAAGNRFYNAAPLRNYFAGIVFSR